MNAPFSSRNCLCLIFLLIALVPAFANLYVIFIGAMILIYIVLALGLNLLIGTSAPMRPGCFKSMAGCLISWRHPWARSPPARSARSWRCRRSA